MERGVGRPNALRVPLYRKVWSSESVAKSSLHVLIPQEIHARSYRRASGEKGEAAMGGRRSKVRRGLVSGKLGGMKKRIVLTKYSMDGKMS